MTTQTDASVIRCPHCQKRNRVRPTASGTPRCANCHRPLPWVVSADQGGFGAEIDASVPVLVDFWAPWCGPCRMISPVVERLAGRYATRMKVVKVNVDENQALAARYDAMSIPLLVLFKDGKEVARQVGAVPEPRLNAWIEPLLPGVGASREEKALDPHKPDVVGLNLAFGPLAVVRGRRPDDGSGATARPYHGDPLRLGVRRRDRPLNGQVSRSDVIGADVFGHLAVSRYLESEDGNALSLGRMPRWPRIVELTSRWIPDGRRDDGFGVVTHDHHARSPARR